MTLRQLRYVLKFMSVFVCDYLPYVSLEILFF